VTPECPNTGGQRADSWRRLGLFCTEGGVQLTSPPGCQKAAQTCVKPGENRGQGGGLAGLQQVFEAAKIACEPHKHWRKLTGRRALARVVRSRDQRRSAFVHGNRRDRSTAKPHGAPGQAGQVRGGFLGVPLSVRFSNFQRPACNSALAWGLELFSSILECRRRQTHALHNYGLGRPRSDGLISLF